jgi:geranylgeranyl reductase family protein
VEADVIVVGAGPGGSTTARELSRRGARVLLLDRATFPRDKACGGGVSVSCAQLLPFDIAPVVEETITGVILGDPRHGTRTRDAGRTLGFLTQRSRFDALLVEQAESVGAEFLAGRHVQAVERKSSGGFRISVRRSGGGREALHARVVIGADGANGVVGRSLGFLPPGEMGVALEGNLPCPDGVPDWLRGRVAITFNAVPGGYAWLFPKADHINIGVGGRANAGPRLRPALEAYTRAFGWDAQSLDGLRGHHLPLRAADSPHAIGAAAVIGDAAGLIDPLTGGGIYAAVVSGMAAASASHDYLAGHAADLRAYDRVIEHRLVPGIRRSYRLADIACGWPSLAHRALAHELTWKVAGRLSTPGDARGADGFVGALGPLARAGRRRWSRDAGGVG